MQRVPEYIIQEQQQNIKGTLFYGIPVTELDRDSLLACVAITGKGLHDAFERSREYFQTFSDFRRAALPKSDRPNPAS